MGMPLQHTVEPYPVVVQSQSLEGSEFCEDANRKPLQEIVVQTQNFEFGEFFENFMRERLKGKERELATNKTIFKIEAKVLYHAIIHFYLMMKIILILH